MLVEMVEISSFKPLEVLVPLTKLIAVLVPVLVLTAQFISWKNLH